MRLKTGVPHHVQHIARSQVSGSHLPVPVMCDVRHSGVLFGNLHHYFSSPFASSMQTGSGFVYPACTSNSYPLVLLLWDLIFLLQIHGLLCCLSGWGLVAVWMAHPLKQCPSWDGYARVDEEGANF